MGISDSMNELERLRSRNSLLIGLTFGIPIVSMFFYGSLMFRSASPQASASTASPSLAFPLLMLFIPVSIVVLLLMANKNRKRFKQLYKETFVVNSLSNYFSQVMYDWENGFSQEQVKNFGLSRMGNRFSSEDYLRGVYKDILFEQADVTIRYHHNTGKSSSTVTYFKGRMFSFTFPKNQVTSLQVHSKNFAYAQSSPSGFKMQKVNLESEDFNKNFVVKTAYEHDAFYIITPALMERIQALSSKYRTVVMYFSDGRLFLGIEGCTDTFDPPMNKKLSYPEEQERIRRDVQDIIDVIDTMTQSVSL